MNNIYFRVIILLLISPFLLAKTPSKEAEKEIIHYFNSGTYDNDLQLQVKHACDYLKQRIDKNQDDKLAIIFDIDETVLSNFEHMKQVHFSDNLEIIATEYLQANSPAIKFTQSLYNYARQNGVAVFFVTGRPNLPQTMDATVKNLHYAGYQGWQKIFLRPLNDNNHSIVPYKSGVRKQITDMGYKVILNIGDQQSDLEGGYAEKSIKLPNPMYTLS